MAVSLGGSDAASGLAGMYYRVDGGGWQGYAGAFTVSGNAGHSVEYYAVDNAGNAGAVQSVAFVVEERFVTLGDGLLVNGTGADDVLTFSVDASSVYVSVNGAGYQASRSQIRNVVLDGKGGVDTGTYTGLPGTDFLWVGPGWAVLSDYSYFLYAGSVEVQHVAGGGGLDYAAVYGSPGNDYFYTAPGVSYLLDWTSYSNALYGFSGVTADAQGGFDQAYYYSSGGSDTFVAGPGVAGMSDSWSYYGAGHGFAVNSGLAGWGGLDLAYYLDSAGADTFAAAPGYGAMSDGLSYASAGYGFAGNYGLATAGGFDQGFFFDSAAADDVFLAGGGAYMLGGPGYLNGAAWLDLAFVYRWDGSAWGYLGAVDASQTASFLL